MCQSSMNFMDIPNFPTHVKTEDSILIPTLWASPIILITGALRRVFVDFFHRLFQSGLGPRPQVDPKCPTFCLTRDRTNDVVLSCNS